MITGLTGVKFNCMAVCKAHISLTNHSTVAPRKWKAEATLWGLVGM